MLEKYEKSNATCQHTMYNALGQSKEENKSANSLNSMRRAKRRGSDRIDMQIRTH